LDENKFHFGEEWDASGLPHPYGAYSSSEDEDEINERIDNGGFTDVEVQHHFRLCVASVLKN
jgi:hypothetical protein